MNDAGSMQLGQGVGESGGIGEEVGGWYRLSCSQPITDGHASRPLGNRVGTMFCETRIEYRCQMYVLHACRHRHRGDELGAPVGSDVWAEPLDEYRSVEGDVGCEPRLDVVMATQAYFECESFRERRGHESWLGRNPFQATGRSLQGDDACSRLTGNRIRGGRLCRHPVPNRRRSSETELHFLTTCQHTLGPW